MGLRIGVIGAGFGGLAASCVLTARGHNVTLFDRNARVGGVAAQFESHGFRFDTGPTSLTSPTLLARIFEEAGRKLEDRVTLVRLNPLQRAFFDDGSTLDLGASDAVQAFLVEGEKLQRSRARFFLRSSIETPRDLLDRDLLRPPFADLLSLHVGQSVASLLRAYVKDPRLVTALESLLHGSSPSQAPALLAADAYAQIQDGAHHPVGGMRAIATSLENLLVERGGQLRLSTGIAKIERENHEVVGVRTDDGERIQFDAVVSNANSVRTIRDLVGREVDDEPSCSGVVLCLGLDQRYDHLAHRNLLLSNDVEAERRAIFEQGELAPDPTCYVTAPSRTEAATAPDGGEAMQVLVQVPYLRPHHDWDAMWPSYRRIILDKLMRAGGMPDLESRIVVEHQVTPQMFHDRFTLQNGALFGLSAHGTVLGGFKPGNRSRQLAGLYLAGGSAHPGAGVPMALLSGWLAADALDRDGRSGRLQV